MGADTKTCCINNKRTLESLLSNHYPQLDHVKFHRFDLRHISYHPLILYGCSHR